MLLVIEVRCDQSGDTAEAPDERSALVAARTLMEEARAAHPIQGFRPTCSFFDQDGEPLRVRVTQQTVWSALGALRRAA